jgi:hypothetical protein
MTQAKTLRARKPMNNPNEVELHDAILNSVDTDCSSKVVTINIELYAGKEDSNRKTACLVFENVESMSQIVSFDSLAANSKAGNINYWSPAKNSGTTHIYLVDGCIAVKAASVRVEIKK